MHYYHSILISFFVLIFICSYQLNSVLAISKEFQSKSILKQSLLKKDLSLKKTMKESNLKKQSKQPTEEADVQNDNEIIMEVASNDGKNSSFLYSLFPVLPKEFKKFFSLSFMMFFIVYVFTMTRDTKDALIVTNCGAESIAFLKVYGVIPAAALFMMGYSYLSNYFTPNHLFYMTLIPFFLFYLFFAFVLYPLRNYLHPISLVAPIPGLTYPYNLLRYWTFSLYYIVSELWGSAGIPLLFWSCANDVVQIEQAKRIYPLISLIGNTGPIFSGITMSLISSQISKISPNDEVAFESSMKVLTGLMMVAGVIITALHYFIRKISEEEALLEQATRNQGQGKGKPTKQEEINASRTSKSKHPKMSLSESIKVLASSKYLMNVATMVLSYGLTIEFTEIIWKATVKAAFPVKTDYLNFMGRYSTLVGSAAFVMMFVGARVVKVLGWKAGALLTPLMMGIFAAPFFGCIILKGSKSEAALLAAVYIGLVTNVLSKATKYAVFDPTKEMAYIPLDNNSKTKGKAAIDVLGARLGKSGGAFVQQVLVLLWGNIFNGAGLVAVLFYVVIAAWIKSVLELSTQFEQSVNELEEQGKKKEKTL